MIRLILLTITLMSFSNVSYASFPVNNISNQFYNQSEPNGAPVIWPAIILLWLVPIIWLFFMKSKTEDIVKKKRLSKIIRYLVFIPIALFVIVLIVTFIQYVYFRDQILENIFN